MNGPLKFAGAVMACALSLTGFFGANCFMIASDSDGLFAFSTSFSASAESSSSLPTTPTRNLPSFCFSNKTVRPS